MARTRPRLPDAERIRWLIRALIALAAFIAVLNAAAILVAVNLG